MAETIKRIGPPRATDLKGEEFTWSVALNQVPSKEWSRLFAEPREATAVCHPKRLGMMHQALVFKCEEAYDAEHAEKHRKAEEFRAEEYKQRRIKEANEKYKGL